MAFTQRLLALLGQRCHYRDKRRCGQIDRIRKGYTRLYRENMGKPVVTKGDCRSNGSPEKVARVGKLTPSTLTPSLANPRRGTPPDRERSSRQRRPISGRVEDESGFAQVLV